MVYCVTVSSSRAGSLGEKFFEWSCKVRYYVRTFIYVFVKRPIVQFVCKTISIKYSRVHISSDTAFLKILKKPSIVQE